MNVSSNNNQSNKTGDVGKLTESKITCSYKRIRIHLVKKYFVQVDNVVLMVMAVNVFIKNV